MPAPHVLAVRTLLVVPARALARLRPALRSLLALRALRPALRRLEVAAVHVVERVLLLLLLLRHTLVRQLAELDLDRAARAIAMDDVERDERTWPDHRDRVAQHAAFLHRLAIDADD